MKPGAVIALVVGGIVILFWAASRGLINSGVPVGRTGIVAPQPSQNYSGYLAASTAPAVTGAINNAITGLSGSLASWLGRPSATVQSPDQGANPSSPSLAAQPVGPQPPPLIGLPVNTANVGPSIDPSMSYDATSGSAFDYSGLAIDNGYDPESSLMYV